MVGPDAGDVERVRGDDPAVAGVEPHGSRARVAPQRRAGQRALDAVEQGRADALALAVRLSLPIFVADEVIDESSIEFEQGEEDNEEVVEKFKDFLDDISPEDFLQDS